MLALCGVNEAAKLATPEHVTPLPAGRDGFYVAFEAYNLQRPVYMAKVREKLAPLALQFINLSGDRRPPSFQSGDNVRVSHAAG